jgi:hypothetical protein
LADADRLLTWLRRAAGEKPLDSTLLAATIAVYSVSVVAGFVPDNTTIATGRLADVA